MAGGLKAREYYLDVTMGYPLALVWNQPRAEFWEPAIAEYEKANRANPPTPGQILFVGGNDFRDFFPKSPDEIAGDFRDLDSLLREALPQARLHYISVKPTLTDWDKWPEIDRLNATIRAYTESDARLNFIDISAAMLGDDGQPRRELFRPDGIHLSAAGYAQWTSIIRPVLMREYGGES